MQHKAVPLGSEEAVGAKHLSSTSVGELLNLTDALSTTASEGGSFDLVSSFSSNDGDEELEEDWVLYCE